MRGLTGSKKEWVGSGMEGSRFSSVGPGSHCRKGSMGPSSGILHSSVAPK